MTRERYRVFEKHVLGSHRTHCIGVTESKLVALLSLFVGDKKVFTFRAKISVPVIVPVLPVVIVIMQLGRISVFLALEKKQKIASLLVRIAKHLLTGTGVNAGHGFGLLTPQTREPSVSAQSQVLHDFGLLLFRDVQTFFFSFQLVRMFFHGHKQSSSSDGHVAQF